MTCSCSDCKDLGESSHIHLDLGCPPHRKHLQKRKARNYPLVLNGRIMNSSEMKGSDVIFGKRRGSVAPFIAAISWIKGTQQTNMQLAQAAHPQQHSTANVTRPHLDQCLIFDLLLLRWFAFIPRSPRVALANWLRSTGAAKATEHPVLQMSDCSCDRPSRLPADSTDGAANPREAWERRRGRKASPN